MKILDPQSATLSNVEVLAHFTLNAPRLSPRAPPNARNFTPKPDLRDHNTVVKEFHNYVTRLSPHLFAYPSFSSESESQAQAQAKTQLQTQPTGQPQTSVTSSSSTPTELTDLDISLRTLITELKPYNLTKAEVLTIINLGVGIEAKPEGEGEGENQGGVDGEGEDVAMKDGGDEVNGVEGEGEGGEEDSDYGALALLDTIIEDRDERLTGEDVGEILKIVRATLGKKGVQKG